jgi:hypothetical protein
MEGGPPIDGAGQFPWLAGFPRLIPDIEGGGWVATSISCFKKEASDCACDNRASRLPLACLRWKRLRVLHAGRNRVPG